MLSGEEKLHVQKSSCETRPVSNNPSARQRLLLNKLLLARIMWLKPCRLLPIVVLYMVTSSYSIMSCKLRVYLARAEQTDENGLRCWDTVKVPACGGRCDSREISDWEFPFKKSHHPVCVYGGRRPLVVRLRHCQHGVATGTDVFHFVAAEDCRCKVCSSEYTSCEWLPPNSTVLGEIYDDFEDIDEE